MTSGSLNGWSLAGYMGMFVWDSYQVFRLVSRLIILVFSNLELHACGDHIVQCGVLRDGPSLNEQAKQRPTLPPVVGQREQSGNLARLVAGVEGQSIVNCDVGGLDY